MGAAAGPNIVEDGLVLCLDAANERSYPGSGTVWSDLSGDENNATLINSVVFEANFNGEMTFDGTDDYCSLYYPSSNFVNNDYTWIIVAKGQHATGTTHNMPDIGYGSTSWPRMGLFENAGNGWSWKSYSSAGSTSGLSLTIIPSPTPSDWVVVAFSADYLNTQIKGYYNGVLTSSSNIYPDVSGNSNRFGIGRAGNTASGWNEQFNGSISSVHIYNRVLSELEIKQNFQALRGRYGI